jgi:hypothetical protein
MHSESAISQIAMRKGYRLENRSEGKYRLVNEGLNAVMHLFDDVTLETIASFFEEAQEDRVDRQPSLIGGLEEQESRSFILNSIGEKSEVP